MELWHPRATRVLPSGTSGGVFVPGFGARQVLHTTEGGPNYTPSRQSFFGNPFWPHSCIGRVNGVAQIVQHLGLNVAAMALEHPAGTIDTNDATSCIQTEICWWASQIAALPEDIAACVHDWVSWVAAQIGAPATFPTFPTAARMGTSEWRSFTGVCGHKDVPNNTHTDPGALDPAIIGFGIPQPTPAPTPEEEPMFQPVPWMTGFPRPMWKLGAGPVPGSSFSVISFDNAPLDYVPIWRKNLDGSFSLHNDKTPFQPGRKDDKGREVDVVTFGLWVRQVYDVLGDPQCFAPIDDTHVAVMTGVGYQYTIGQK